MTFVIAVSVLIGYAAFGSFLLEQFFWVCAVASMLFMSIVLAEEAIGAGLAPTTPIGHRLVTSIGFNRNSLELTGVLICRTDQACAFHCRGRSRAGTLGASAE